MSDTEETLDPRSWDEVCAVGHRAIDDLTSYLATIRERAPWRPVPAETRRRLEEPAPREPMPLADVYAAVRRDVLPYPTGNIHPRFWGWVMGTGSAVASLAELIAATMNPHVAGYDQSATFVERQVIAWMVELFGFAPATGGLLVSGGTMANLIGLATARHARAGFDVRAEGLRAGPPLTVYASAATHSWLERSAELLGLGRAAMRRIRVDDADRIDLAALAEAVASDRRAGARPICVVGNAGTVNIGATDDLSGLARFCREQQLWFHVDGAFGALAALAPALRPIVAGITEADSLAFDLHKWGWLPYEIGCTLVRDDEALRAAFATVTPYLAPLDRGIAAEPLGFADRGVQLSRGFRALKLWMALKQQGALAWGRIVEQNVRQAQHLARLVAASTDLQLLAPAALNVVCFRYHSAALSEPELDALNETLLVELQERGVAVPSGTRVRGRFALRVANTNHRTRTEDIELLVDAVHRIGRELALAGPPYSGSPAIVPYRDDFRADFERLNRQWLEALFGVEPADLEMFADPRATLLDGGGQVFFAVEAGRVLGTVALRAAAPGELELCKLAVAPAAQRRGLGDRLVGRALAYAQAQGATRVTALSNTRLDAALRLYRRHGFHETRRGPHPHWRRVDVELARQLSG